MVLALQSTLPSEVVAYRDQLGGCSGVPGPSSGPGQSQVQQWQEERHSV